MSRKQKSKREAATIAVDGAADLEPAAPRNLAHYWPDDKPLPTSVVKPRPVPCPACRRVRLDTGSPAAIVRTYKGGVCYMRCRACEHRFKMAVARAL